MQFVQRRVALGAALLLASACADGAQPVQPLAPSDAAQAAGPQNGFAVVRVKPGIGKPAGSPGPVVATLEDAVAQVAPGGRIVVDAGTYAVHNLVLAKPLTMEPASGAQVVIRNDTAVTSLAVNSMSGTVTLRGLHFEAHSAVRNSGSVLAFGAYDQVVVEDASFVVGEAANRGLQATRSSVPGGRVVVRNSTFRGGALGTMAAGAHMDVIDSRFSDHWFSGIQFQQGASGRVEGNTVERCGRVNCIRVHQPDGVQVVGNRVHNAHGRGVHAGIAAFGGGSSVEIRDNEVVGAGGSGRAEADHALRFGIHVEGVAEATVVGNQVGGAYDGIVFGTVARGSIQGNTVDPCGAWSCINVYNGQEIAVTGNTVRSHLDRRTFFGIQAGWPHTAGRLSVTDNRIEGVGAPSDPAVQSTYPLQIAFQVGAWYRQDPTEGPLPEPQGQSVEFSRNTMLNAEVGVRAFHGGVVHGTDNRFDVVWGEVLGAHDYGINRIQRSDVTRYRDAFASSVGGTLEVTCNWWGAASGPVDVWGPTAGATYAPWATGPIADGAGGACDGGV